MSSLLYSKNRNGVQNPNRRMPNGMYGGERGRLNSPYLIFIEWKSERR
mgnify:CR=1 FL=1